jgi:putative redox protein
MMETKATVQAALGQENYRTVLAARQHQLVADEPPSLQGTDLGMTPYELLLASLGACTCITVRMYAQRKGFDLASVTVDLQLVAHTVDAREVLKIIRHIGLEGDLADEARQRILAIANNCPVHRLLAQGLTIESALI